jgi:thioredoxin reductase (NADPH)
MAARDLLIVGAGPSGLATAIAAQRRGLDCAVIEKGVLVNSIFHFPTHMVFFTTPELLEIGGLPLISPFEKPTRLEALRYYRRVVDVTGVHVSLQERVLEIERDQAGVFAVITRDGRGAQRVRHARAVVLAIGYSDLPNVLGVPGEDLPHVTHYYQDAHPYYRRRVVVHRRPTLGDSIKYWVRPDIENRIREGSIAARFDTQVVEISPTDVVVERGGARESLAADAVFLLTGYHPDVDLMRRAGVRCDPASLEPDIDADTFETNVPNLFIAGGATAGRRTGNIFIENGRFHGERIVATLGDRLRPASV